MDNQPIPLMGYACGLGAGDTGTGLGPEAIANRLSFQKFTSEFLYPSHEVQGLAAMEVLAEINLRLAQQTFQFAEASQRFITLGGDHSCAIGTWSGVASALQPRGDLGLIWFDAHMDSHTPSTTPSNNIHGMPVATLLGEGDASLTEILTVHRKIKPANLCLIGVRSFEPEEKKLLDSLQVRVFYMDEINERGIDVIINEALALVTRDTAGFGVSFDLDVMDPLDAPGVGSPAPDGLRAKSLLNAIPILGNHPDFVGLEVAEYNPNLDINELTQNFALQLINTLFSIQ